MGKKIVRHIWNAISGIFVLLLSLWMSGPGIGETDKPTYSWYFMLMFVLWIIGFVLQFKKRFRVIGVVITLIPVVYHLTIYLRAAFI